MAKKRLLWKRADAACPEYEAQLHMTHMRVYQIHESWFAVVSLTCGYVDEHKEPFKSMIAARRWAESEAWKQLTTIREYLTRDYDLDIKRLTGAIKKRAPKRKKRKAKAR